MNILIILIIIILVIFSLVFIFINLNEKSYNKNLHELDTYLLKYLTIDNYFNNPKDFMSVKSKDEIEEVMSKISQNSSSWSFLFDKKFSSTLSNYSIKNRSVYLNYSYNRKLLVDNFIRELHTLISSIHENSQSSNNYSKSLFIKNFYFGYYKPTSVDKHFSEISSNIQEQIEIKSLDTQFLDLSSKDNFFMVIDQNITNALPEEKYHEIRDKIKQNFSNWENLITKLTLEPSISLNSLDKEYILSRKNLSKSLITSLEYFLANELNRNKSSFPERWFYGKFNSQGNLGDYLPFKNFINSKDNFYSIRKY